MHTTDKKGGVGWSWREEGGSLTEVEVGGAIESSKTVVLNLWFMTDPFGEWLNDTFIGVA